MKYKFLLFFFFVLHSHIKSQEKGENAYIEMRYAGEQTSLHPVFTFYTSWPNDTSKIWGRKNVNLQIGKATFDEICKLIENQEQISRDSALSWLYEFKIVNKNEFRIFRTPYLDRIKKTFSHLIYLFEDGTIKENLNNQLQIALLALRYEYTRQ